MSKSTFAVEGHNFYPEDFSNTTPESALQEAIEGGYVDVGDSVRVFEIREVGSGTSGKAVFTPTPVKTKRGKK